MAKSKNRRKNRKNISFILDEFSSSDIRRWELIKNHALKYHWDFYFSLTFQRSQRMDELTKCLQDATQKGFKFESWQRTVQFKYAVEPLSVEGSVVDLAGGRFNIGQIKPSEFQPFPALYIASDRDTALQEVICNKLQASHPGIDPLELALTDRSSISHVSVSGQLNSIINLNKPETLQSFVDLIKNFEIPDHVRQEGKLFQWEPALIKTVTKLIDALLDPNWREWPMQFDVPVASQIFGQMVMNAGIDGVLYRSKFSNKDCLVIFPQNLVGDFFVTLDDPAPKETKILRWDSQTWKKFQK